MKPFHLCTVTQKPCPVQASDPRPQGLFPRSPACPADFTQQPHSLSIRLVVPWRTTPLTTERHTGGDCMVQIYLQRLKYRRKN